MTLSATEYSSSSPSDTVLSAVLGGMDTQGGGAVSSSFLSWQMAVTKADSL